jgi:hypothetical protein
MGQNVTDLGQDKKELKKHAATIHCSNTLSLLQRKITNALLYHAYKELMLKDEHEITVKQLCRLIGYQGNNHSVIKDALKGLISTIIEWNVINDETGIENWTASSIIASVSLEGPLCYYAYSPRMKQLLHSPSMFGKIDLVIQSRFRSSYGLALYENCIRYRGLPNTKWFNIELFKKLMGVPVGKYDIFRDFKRRVLDKAIEEVNSYSDLIIESEFVREGRKVVKIRFKLKDRAKKTRLGIKKPQQLIIKTTEMLKDKLCTTFSLSDEQAHVVLTEYDNEFIWDKIGIIERSKPFQEGKIKNPAGYLLSAIKNNYQIPTPILHSSIDDKDTQFAFELITIKKQVEAIRLSYNHYRENIIHRTVDSLPENERNIFMEQFSLSANTGIKNVLKLQRNKYCSENILESPQIKALFRQFAIRELDLLYFVSLEEFVTQLEESKREAWQKLKSYDPDHPLLRFSE